MRQLPAACRYNLRTRDPTQLLKKQWTIITMDEHYNAAFRLKTCAGGGEETAATAYYLCNWCRSLAQVWKHQLVPNMSQMPNGWRTMPLTISGT